MTQSTDKINGALVGYRVWSVSGVTEPKLKGLVAREIWKSGVNNAKCKSPHIPAFIINRRGDDSETHRVAHAKCTCGFHAYFTIDHVQQKYTSTKNYLAGAIISWGKTQLHNEGFRAEYAQPVALFNSHHPKLQQVAELYGIPIFDTWEEVHAYSTEFGQIWQEDVKIYKPTKIAKIATVICGGLMLMWLSFFIISALVLLTAIIFWGATIIFSIPWLWPSLLAKYAFVGWLISPLFLLTFACLYSMFCEGNFKSLQNLKADTTKNK